MNVTVVLIGILGIYFGSSWVVRGASRLAQSFGVSQLFIGLTLVTLITSGPELLIGLNAANADAGGIVMGTVVGSNIVNIGLILGMSVLIGGRIAISSTVVRRGIPVMVAVAVLLYILLLLGEVTPTIGAGLIVAFFAVLSFLLWQMRRDTVLRQLITAELEAVKVVNFNANDALLEDDPKLLRESHRKAYVNRTFEMARLIAGIIVLLVGADYIVKGALNMVDQLDANEITVGVTFVALATSLPEFIAIPLAAARKQPDVALGNIIGAGIFNLLFVVGIASIIEPIYFDPRLLRFEYPAMIGFMLLLFPFLFDRVFSWAESALMVSLYALFVVMAFVI